MSNFTNRRKDGRCLIGAHWITTHHREIDYDYMAKIQAPINKVVSGPIDVSEVSRMYQESPESMIVLRDHPLSEQKDDMYRDPAGTGKRHAQEMMGHFFRMQAQAKERGIPFPLQQQTILIGINEPNLDGGPRAHMDYTEWYNNTKHLAEVLDIYTAAFLGELTAYGFIGGAFNLSVGWPANLKDGETPYWGFFTLTEKAIKQGNHYLILHEYWSRNGPKHNWGWWAGRFTYCPWDVPIIIGECGIDQYVADGVDNKSTRGYKGGFGVEQQLDELLEQYANQLFEYEQLCFADPRIVSILVFTSDGMTQDWGSFDLDIMYKTLIPKIQNLTNRPKGSSSKPQPVDGNGNNSIIIDERIVTAQILNIRSGPGTNYEVIGRLEYGAKVNVYEIMVDGITQWHRIGSGKWVSSAWTQPVTDARPPTDSTMEDHNWLVRSLGRILQIDTTTIWAVIKIESGGNTFVNNRLLIRFENHIFAARLNNPDLYKRYFEHGNPQWAEHKFRKSIDMPWRACHTGRDIAEIQAGEWEVFEFARTLNEQAALESISMGAAQVMGFNYASVGYDSVLDMFADYSDPKYGAMNQIIGFFAYCMSRPGLIDAIRNHDWYKVAELYNGSGQRESYGKQLKDKYEELLRSV